MQPSALAIKGFKELSKLRIVSTRIVAIHRVADKVGKLNAPARATVYKYGDFGETSQLSNLRTSSPAMRSPSLHQILDTTLDLGAFIGDWQASLPIAR